MSEPSAKKSKCGEYLVLVHRISEIDDNWRADLHEPLHAIRIREGNLYDLITGLDDGNHFYSACEGYRPRIMFWNGIEHRAEMTGLNGKEMTQKWNSLDNYTIYELKDDEAALVSDWWDSVVWVKKIESPLVPNEFAGVLGIHVINIYD
jgi:hypothetical protein